MLILQNNLATRERLFQVINPSGQLIYEKSLTPYLANALIGTSSSSKMLVGNGAVNQVASKLPYNAVLKSPVKYPNLTDSENKFLNDYMGKEIPGKIVSKYNDVNKYEYNATTNPGPLAEGKNPPINNFYGGMFVRMGDKTYPYGSWYTKVPKNSEVEARIDLAIKNGGLSLMVK